MFGRVRPGVPRGTTGARDPGAPSGLSSVVIFFITNMAYFVVAAIVPLHLLFAVEEHSFAVRVLTAIPAVVLVLEAQRFLKSESGELPFLVISLLQYYVVFCFGVFFELPFYDVRGPVNFSPEARLAGALAVALGSLCLWGGARWGRRVGARVSPWVLRAMPRRERPEQWDRAFYLYASAAVVVALVFILAPNAVPGTLVQPVLYAFPLEMFIGFGIVAPPRRLGQRAAYGLVGVTMFLGVLRGQLDPVFRAAIAFLSGSWAQVRRVSLRLVAAVLVAYVLIQPVKASFREQVWGSEARTGQVASVSDRMGAWQNAFSTERKDTEKNAGMARLSELAAVMHAFDVLPGRVTFLDGAGFVTLLTAPIPRFIWPGKPTTRDTISRYAIVFGRQSEVASLSTSINLPLLVEGYWNFGWPGIAVVCVALGLWVGMSQRIFASDHWAIRATGIANLTNITVAGAVINVYSSIFQMVTGRLLVCWTIFWLAQLLSRREYEGPELLGGRAMLRRR
jgi:hypothetical protein